MLGEWETGCTVATLAEDVSATVVTEATPGKGCCVAADATATGLGVCSRTGSARAIMLIAPGVGTIVPSAIMT